MWRGHLPHWRADDVLYYVTFRYRRPLDQLEMQHLFSGLLRPDGTSWDLTLLAVGPEHAELIFRILSTSKTAELSKIVERQKSKVSSKIIKKSGERYPVFYTESFDRIIRDEAELVEKLQNVNAIATEEWLVFSREDERGFEPE